MKKLILCSSVALLGSVYNDGTTLEELQAKAGDISDKLTAIVNLADQENRDLTDDELTTITELNGQFEKTAAQITARSAAAKIVNKSAQSNGRKTVQQLTNKAVLPGTKPDGKKGFANFGEFSKSVAMACLPDAGQEDSRLIRNEAPGSEFNSEITGSDGGFLVPDDFRAAFQTKVEGEDSLLARCNVLDTMSNNITVPQNNVSPWDTENGVQAYWEGEAKQIDKSKIKVDTKSQRLHKLTALIPVTDELLEDSVLLDAWMKQEVNEKFDFSISRAILAGDGVGKPLGVWNSAACITIAPEAAQPVGTIVFENIINMWSRLYSGCQARSIWIANQDTLPQLMSLKFPGDGRPVYIPGGVIAGAAFGTLFGRPIVFHEAAETVGQRGDLTLVDLEKYLIARKAAGLQAAQSMHLYFDYDMAAFRFV